METNQSIIILFSLLLIFFAKRWVVFGDGHTSILVNVVFVWTVLYGVVAPLLALNVEYSRYLIFKEWYGVASLILGFSFFVFILFVKRFFLKYDSRIWGEADFSLLCWIVIFGMLLFLAMYNYPKYQVDIFTIFILPALVCIYAYLPNGVKHRCAVVTLHLLVIFLGVMSGYLTDSKERIFSTVIFPILAYVTFGVKSKFLKKIYFLALFVFMLVIGLLASSIVRESRAQESIADTDVLSEERYIAIVERLAVIDALGAAVDNEFSNQLRPSSPEWAILGFIGQVGPALFDRPNHAREAIRLTGYSTSTDEVNIALTVPGHFLWSFGWFGLFFSILFFWFSTVLVLYASKFLGGTLGSLFYFYFLIHVFRLESVGYAFFASIFTAYVFYWVVGRFYNLMSVRKLTGR